MPVTKKPVSRVTERQRLTVQSLFNQAGFGSAPQIAAHVSDAVEAALKAVYPGSQKSKQIRAELIRARRAFWRKLSTRIT